MLKIVKKTISSLDISTKSEKCVVFPRDLFCVPLVDLFLQPFRNTVLLKSLKKHNFEQHFLLKINVFLEFQVFIIFFFKQNFFKYITRFQLLKMSLFSRFYSSVFVLSQISFSQITNHLFTSMRGHKCSFLFTDFV